MSRAIGNGESIAWTWTATVTLFRLWMTNGKKMRMRIKWNETKTLNLLLLFGSAGATIGNECASELIVNLSSSWLNPLLLIIWPEWPALPLLKILWKLLFTRSFLMLLKFLGECFVVDVGLFTLSLSISRDCR